VESMGLHAEGRSASSVALNKTPVGFCQKTNTLAKNGVELEERGDLGMCTYS